MKKRREKQNEQNEVKRFKVAHALNLLEAVRVLGVKGRNDFECESGGLFCELLPSFLGQGLFRLRATKDPSKSGKEGKRKKRGNCGNRMKTKGRFKLESFELVGLPDQVGNVLWIGKHVGAVA